MPRFVASLALFSVAALIVCLPASSQIDDRHLSDAPLRALYARSAFAHGYMHGYEEGFHCADLNLQLGRNFTDVKSQTKYKKIDGYSKSFGDRKLFDDGYRQGFAVAYGDAFSDRSFRAHTLFREAASGGLDHPDKSASPDSGFDRAFKSGYDQGQLQGLNDGRASRTEHRDPECPSSADPKANCDAFRRGYLIGYSDGYANQRETNPVFARR